MTPNEVYKCPACEKREAAERQCTECLKSLPPSAFGHRPDGHLHKVCRDCQFPTCTKCGQKSTKMSQRVAKENNAYVCDDCRTKRICKGRCGKALPLSAFDSDTNRHMYKICRDCRVCDDSRTERVCKGRCGESLPPSAFDRDNKRRMYQVCRQCRSK